MVRVIIYGGKLNVKDLYKDHRVQKSDYKPYDTSRTALQMDLIDLRRISRRRNVRPYRYILVVIEQKSRYLWTVLMRKKSADNALEALESIIDDIKEKVPDVSRIRSDDSAAFKSEGIRKLFSDYGIEHKLINTSVHGKTSLALVERVNKTIIYDLVPAINDGDEQRSIDEILNELTKGYNEKKHSATQCSPIDVINGECSPVTTKKGSKYTGPYPIGSFVLRAVPKDDSGKRVMRYYPAPYLIDWVDEYSGKHHLIDMVTTEDYPILLPKYMLAAISREDADYLIDNYDKHMKIYRREQKDRKSTRRQQVLEFDIIDDILSSSSDDD